MAAKKKLFTKTVEFQSQMTVLGIDSNYDPVTLAAFNYREQHVYPKFAAQGFAVIKCQGTRARRFYVAPEARRPEVVYLTGVGHGLYDTYTGYYGDIIFQVGNYQPDEVDGKIVHFLSCQTARTLGPDFVRNGCRAFFGYDENFTFIMADKDIFFACDSEIDLAFANGLTASAVYARTLQLFNRQIAALRAAGKFYVAAVLEFDRDHLQCPATSAAWGDNQAVLN